MQRTPSLSEQEYSPSPTTPHSSPSHTRNIRPPPPPPLSKREGVITRCYQPPFPSENEHCFHKVTERPEWDMLGAEDKRLCWCLALARCPGSGWEMKA